MDTPIHWLLIPSVFLVALLYSSVGQGGGSGYLAVLSLLAIRPEQMATTALTLNLVVAGIGLIAFLRAGHFSGRLTWPFVTASVPAAFLGGLTRVSAHAYAVLLAFALIVAAWRLLMEWRREELVSVKPPMLAVALPVGGAIGWLSGVVGVGGGIFLSPLCLLRRWADVKQTAATSACFILVNSAAGLAGRLVHGTFEGGGLWPLLLAACAGGVIGSRLGANHFSGRAPKRVLAAVLLVAALKLLKVTWGA